jgi:hypothetical protein
VGQHSFREAIEEWTVEKLILRLFAAGVLSIVVLGAVACGGGY